MSWLLESFDYISTVPNGPNKDLPFTLKDHDPIDLIRIIPKERNL